MTRRLPVLLTALLGVACGGGPDATEPEPATAETAGGEDEVARVDPPIRATTPVPVPQPATPRDELSDALQQVWTRVEETVAIRPPEGPDEATEAAVQAWSEGPFRAWIDARHAAMRETVTASEGVPEEPAAERAVASALLGYALEDFVADVRGAPIPAAIAEDEALLQVYVDSLMEVLRPVALESVISYAYCQRRLAALGDASPWLPWRAYCVQRGQDVVEIYELQPHELQPEVGGGEAGAGDEVEAGERDEAVEDDAGDGASPGPTSSRATPRPRPLARR
ncbi:MAG TPA: hypothetical protein RMH99_09030 [Sandaracinaceae bacterium LLY-WYZ-13_1]|nr:hypothetical protein [Sandaracinaceae bacterium LLY-WYZ-13_1]